MMTIQTRQKLMNQQIFVLTFIVERTGAPQIPTVNDLLMQRVVTTGGNVRMEQSDDDSDCVSMSEDPDA